MELDSNGAGLPELGERVFVQGRLGGVVRFAGETQFKEGLWVGVELDEPRGKNDGSVASVEYFRCAPSHGLFVRPDALKNPSQAAASVVQSHVRKHLAKKKVDAEMTARTWNILDAYNEDQGLRVSKQMNDALRQEEFEDMERMEEDYSGATTVEELQSAAQRAVDAMTDSSLSSMAVDQDYEGPHLNFPLTFNAVLTMLDEFKLDKVLHYKYFMLLLLKTRRLLSATPTLQDIVLPTDGSAKITIVGDTHGQLQDLFTIFTINGIPSETNWYLFNGDFVDRGSKGCEILSAMMCFKLLYPDHVFFNRGNHEARAQNQWMGFEEEVLQKYGEGNDCCTTDPNDRLAALKLYTLVESMFDALPLAAVIQEKVFVCHGGLFRNDGVTLNHLRSIKRKREPPLEGRSFEDRVYEDLLWSDPRPTAQYVRPLNGRRASDRGAGCEFGPAVTNQFCATNQIALCVRSHECVPEGYEVLHNGRLITIFSASRYCGTQTNKGAFITFGPELQPEIQQFYAHAVQEGTFVSEEERETRLRADTVHMIVEQICDKRLDLYWYFTQNDTMHTGRVTRVEWATALQNVLGLDLPFLHYRDELVENEENGKINYSQFLSRFQITMREMDAGWQDGIINRICEKLFAICGADVKSAYAKFDTNDDGQIEYEEFMRTLRSLDVGLTDNQIFELMRSVDVNDDGHIDFQEFAERFEVAFDNLPGEEPMDERMRSESMQLLQTQAKNDMPDAQYSPRAAGNVKLNWEGLDDFTLTNLKRLGATILSKAHSLVGAFKLFDKHERKYLSEEDFVTTAVGLEIGLDEAGAKRLFDAVDTNASGRINYLEFLDAFQVTDTHEFSDSWKHGVVQQVANVLYQHRIHLKAAFRMFDVNHTGVINASEFMRGMRVLNSRLDSPLTRVQIDELRRAGA